jgi:hypothetical protein
VIEPTDLTGIDEVMALRILAVARSIAPCLDSLIDEPRKSAIAILTGVAGEARDRGSRLVQSQRVGTASVTYRTVESWFSDDDRDALRGLCSVAEATAGPVGSFPRPDTGTSRLWPERNEERYPWQH